MKLRHIILLVAATSLLATAAGAVDEGWRLRLNTLYVAPAEQVDFVVGTGRFAVSDSDTGIGGGLNAEYRFSSLLGLELGVLAGGDVDFGFSNMVSMRAASAGVNFHFASGGKTDLYAGPLLAVAQYGDFSAGPLFRPPGSPLPPRVRVTLDDDFAVGANLGVDVPMGEGNWLFNANARYLITTIDAETSSGVHGTVDYDPLMLGVGFGYRFSSGKVQ